MFMMIMVLVMIMMMVISSLCLLCTPAFLIFTMMTLSNTAFDLYDDVYDDNDGNILVIHGH